MYSIIFNFSAGMTCTSTQQRTDFVTALHGSKLVGDVDLLYVVLQIVLYDIFNR